MNNVDGDKKRAQISSIVAIGKNRVIGKENGLLWRISDDLKRFKRLTVGHPVIMGRKTWESIPAKFRPLPDRPNIVVTRQEGYQAPGAHVSHSLEDALTTAKGMLGAEEIFIIGGAQIYAEALQRTNRLYLTVIDDAKEGDAYFPPYEHLFTKTISDELHESDGLKYHWITLEK